LKQKREITQVKDANSEEEKRPGAEAASGFKRHLNMLMRKQHIPHPRMAVNSAIPMQLP